MGASKAAKLENSDEIVSSQMEKLGSQFPDTDIKELERRLKALKKKTAGVNKQEKRDKKALKADVKANKFDKKRLEMQRKASKYQEKAKKLREESKGIFRRAWDKIKNAIKYVAGKVKDGVKAILGWIKRHPILTIILLLIGAGIYYYSQPLAAGYSGMAETAAEITAETARETLDVGPTIGPQGTIPTIIL
ncbi:hypothetical protein HN709_02870 [Candidatus Peregrinibacteria bacterium]|jgi:hypothetical protein|nr:hypothetical protein [Candidatus Peregrinibacteria bacterium]MBT7736607.1 hypothetical protein [Candidatus Peregrinibacteria bacterium]